MEATVCRKRDLSSHFSPQTLWFSEKLRETHWRRFTAAHKRVEAMVRSKKALSAHFCLKPHPPRADFISTLSAQRHTGSAAKAAAEFRYEQGGGICTFCRGSERGDAAPRVSGGKKWTTGWSGPLGPFFRAHRAGKGNQPFFFPYKMEITPAREKLVAQRSRREGACQPSRRSKRDFSRRSIAPAGAFRRPTAVGGS